MQRSQKQAYRRTLLGGTNTAVYEPRKGVFQNSYKTKDLTATTYTGRAADLVHYPTNGTGRDTYIHNYNGGFSVENKPIKWPVVGSISQKPHRHAVKAKPNPVIHTKNVFYRANGTGRDSYIETTSGGQFSTLNATFDYRENFKKTLRSYDRTTSKHRAPRPLSSTPGTCNPIIRRTNLGKEKLLKSINDLTNLKDEEKIDTSVFANQGPGTLSVKPRLFLQDGDILTQSQSTYNTKFMVQQSQLDFYQKTMDSRLSVPKHQRNKIVGDFRAPDKFKSSLQNFNGLGKDWKTIDNRSRY